MLGTYFAKSVVSFGKEEVKTGGVRTDASVVEGYGGRGRRIHLAMYCWASGWRLGLRRGLAIRWTLQGKSYE